MSMALLWSPSPTSEATLQILEHTLQILSGNSLKDFVVPKEYLKALLDTPIPDLPRVIAPEIADRFILRIASWLGMIVSRLDQGCRNEHWTLFT